MNGKVTRSCLTKLGKIKDGAEITTIEGICTLSDLHPLQVAWMAHGCAQCGFCSPGFIMTAKVLLDNNNAPTREEVRDWFQKNRNLCRCTGYKPLVDAVMDAARVIRGEITKEDLIFKPTGDSIVGTKYIRPSAAQKVTGTWDFGADDALKMPEGTLRLALVQAKVSHALIKGIDTAAAEKMPGVAKIITAKDIVAAGGKNRINGLVMLPLNNKCDGWDRPVLCGEKIFQFGDAIAIVAADTEAHARAAADAVVVDIEQLPAYMNAMDAIAEDAIEIHPGTPNAYYETNCIKDPDFDFDSAPNVVEIESYCSRQPHLHLEPDCGYAYIDEDGMVTVHSKSIGIHLHMPMIADGIDTKVQGQWVATYCAEHPVDQATSQGDPFSVYMYTLFLPEVCVDTQTGKVTVEKFTCVADVGTIMNKLLVDGNFYGGLAQGISLALSEDFDDLTKHTSLKGCGIPYPKDVPDDIELHYVETYRPEGPYGAAGCGEAPLDAPHPAILNAIYNATGARITRIPALPEVVLAALKDLEK